MFEFFFGRIFAWQRIVVVSALVLTIFAFPASTLGQDSEVTEEAAAELTVSAEALKESEVDIKAELGLPQDYDPVVPNNFINSVRYGFKKFGRNVQEAWYDGFGSDKSHAEIMKSHADRELVEATKLHSLEPDNSRIVGILGSYRDDLRNAGEVIEKVKEQDPTFAKNFTSEMAEDHLFIAPKVLNALEENLIQTQPGIVPELIKVKEEALQSVGNAVVNAADDEREITETLKILAEKNFKTPFSGIGTADILTQAKQHLPEEDRAAFDEAIKASLDNVESNFKSIDVADELKVQAFQRYVEQLPGSGLARIKVMDEFRSTTDLPPEMIEKMTEMKARIAERMSQRIEQAPSEMARRALTDAMFKFQEGKMEDLKLLNEIKDIVPNEEIRQHMNQKHEEGVAKFLNKFGDDQNAQAVTEEFQALTRKVESGGMIPDANFFKTLEDLKTRLSPEQQRFIDEMEETGKKEMVERMKQDGNFAERFGSFNPADIEYFEKFRGELQGEVADFEGKFREIERQQSDNFRKLLDMQDDPEKVREFKQHFEGEIPESVKQRFEQRYEFKFEDQYQKFEERARERKEFSGQEQFPGEGKPRLIGPPICADGTSKTDYGCEIKFEKKQFDPGRLCAEKGGNWKGSFCEFASGESQRGSGPVQKNNPEEYCSKKGGTWTGKFCQLPEFKPPQDEGNKPDEAYKRKLEEGGDLPVPKREEFDPQTYCARKGGTFRDNTCHFGSSEPISQPPVEKPPEFISPTVEQPSPEVRGISIERPFLGPLFDFLSLP